MEAELAGERLRVVEPSSEKCENARLLEGLDRRSRGERQRPRLVDDGRPVVGERRAETVFEVARRASGAGPDPATRSIQAPASGLTSYFFPP